MLRRLFLLRAFLFAVHFCTAMINYKILFFIFIFRYDMESDLSNYFLVISASIWRQANEKEMPLLGIGSILNANKGSSSA